MPGQLVHFEIPAQDTARAKGFYADLFGWKFEPYQGAIEYHVTQAGGDPGGGLYPSQSGERGPIVYFDVDDMDAAVARVRELGGESEDKQPIPSIGWFARCKDTEGNAFSLFKSDESVQPPSA